MKRDPQPRAESLEELPRGLFGGYDRDATERLFANAAEGRTSLLRENQRLQEALRDAESQSAEHEGRVRQLEADLERLDGDLESSRGRETELTEALERAKTRFEEDLLAVRDDLETRLERARLELERELASTREELSAELAHAKTKLSTFERRELRIQELLEAAAHYADRTTQEARTQAHLALKKARKRESEILEDARREAKRVEAEHDRLAGIAERLRTDLSAALAITLEQLAMSDGEADVPPLNLDQFSQFRLSKGNGSQGTVPARRTRAVNGDADSRRAEPKPVE